MNALPKTSSPLFAATFVAASFALAACANSPTPTATIKTGPAATVANVTAISPRYAALQPFVGEWATNFTSGADGRPVRLEFRIAWLENKEGQSIDTWVVRGSDRLPQSSGLYVWNPVKREFTLLETRNDGALFEGTANVSGNELELRFDITKLDGTTSKSGILFRQVSADILSGDFYSLNEQGAWEKQSEQQFHRKQ
jgi:hypothetical protein